MPATEAASFKELQGGLDYLKQDNLDSEDFNASQGGVVEGQQPMSLTDYVQMQEDNANAQNEYVQNHPKATPAEKEEASTDYSKAMSDVKYMRDNPEATAVQNRLSTFNDPKSATSRADLEGRGSATATSDLLGVAKATGFGADDMQRTGERADVLNSQLTHLQRASDLNERQLEADPKNAQLLARRSLYSSKANDIREEYATMQPSDAATYAYGAGTLLTPEESGETYAAGKVLKGVGSGAKAGAKKAMDLLSRGGSGTGSALATADATSRTGMLARAMDKSKAELGKGLKPVVDTAAKLAPALTAGAGKALGSVKQVASVLGNVGSKALVPLAAADAMYSGGKAAWGDSPEAEANREMHRRQAETGETLAFMTPRDPNMSKSMHNFQETIKAVNPARAAAQLGTMGRDIGTTAGQYIEADEDTKQAMRDGVSESLANNAFYKAQGGEKGWAQDVGDYYAGPDWQKEDVHIANPEAAASNKQMFANRKRIAEANQPSIKSTMETAKKTANTRTPAPVKLGEKS